VINAASEKHTVANVLNAKAHLAVQPSMHRIIILFCMLFVIVYYFIIETLTWSYIVCNYNINRW